MCKVNLKQLETKAASLCVYLFFTAAQHPLLPSTSPIILVMVHVFWKEHMSSGLDAVSVYMCVCVCENQREGEKCESMDLKLHKPFMSCLRGTCLCVEREQQQELSSKWHSNSFSITGSGFPVLIALLAGLHILNEQWTLCCFGHHGINSRISSSDVILFWVF